MNKTVATIIGLGLLAVTLSGMAHHSTAMFDSKQRLTFEGTVKEWEWTNPHAFLIIMGTHKGEIVPMGFELGSPNTLVRNGFAKSTFKPGDKVTIVGSPRVDGEPGGALTMVKTADGRWLQWGPGADAKAAAAAGVPE